MIIECGSCNSRFRLDDSRITGKGARVRCRKCGAAITVLKEQPDAPARKAAEKPTGQEASFDLRAVLEGSLGAGPGVPPAPPDAPAPGPDAAESRDPGSPAVPGPAVEIPPEETITFAAPGEGRPAGEATPPAAEPAPSGFMMSTADSLDFLKADYERGEPKPDLDVSGNLRIAPAVPVEESRVPPPMGTQRIPAPEPAEPPRPEPAPGEAAASGAAATAGAAAGPETLRPADPADARPAAPPPPRPLLAPPFPPPRPAAAPKPARPARMAPSGKRASIKKGQAARLVRPSVIVLLLVFCVLAGGGAYLSFTAEGQRVLEDLVPKVEALWRGAATPATRYVVGNLVGYYETGAAAGKMFVVKGQVTNEGGSRKSGVRVYAALFDAKNGKLAEKTVYAGNVFAGDTLRHASRQKIESVMSNPIGGGLANMDIPPGKAVPFMVVFLDAPEGIDSYRLEPRDVD